MKVFILIVAFCVGFPRTAWAKQPEIRVHVANAASVVLAGDLEYEGQNIHGSGRSFTVTAKAGNLRVASRADRGPIEFTSDNGIVTVAGRKYRGSLSVYLAGGKVQVVNLVPLEFYLASVLGGEMGKNWPQEALRAQAVVARSYVLAKKEYSKKRPFDVDATVLSQVYHGTAGESPNTRDAVKATQGKILTYRSRVIEAYFHSCCGGQTENAEALWGVSLGYLTPVKDSYCEFAPDYFWRFKIGPAELGKKVGLPPVIAVSIIKKAPGGRAIEVKFESRGKSKILGGDAVRRALGYNKLKSTLFRISAEKKQFVFKGSGSGHGVGMCQWGARAQAEKGRTYRDILKYYFPEADLDRM